MTIDAGGLRAVRADADGADAVIAAAPPTVGAVVYGGLPLDQAHASGALTLEGDRRLVVRFADLFPLPRKAPIPDKASG